MEGMMLEQALKILAKCDTPAWTACWTWRFSTAGGYAQHRFPDGHSEQAHRVVYKAAVGDIPDGLVLDHECRNRRCCNPLHVIPKTHRDNILAGEGLAAQQVHRRECPSGHPYDEANTRLYRGRRYCRACQNRKRDPKHIGIGKGGHAKA